MACCNHNAPLCRHFLTFRMTVESARAVVHGRCQHIGFQAQQQLTHFVVGFRTYIIQFFFKVLSSPRLHSPVLIVNENATILDGG